MVDQVNYVIYNAPAGSGKTTTLKHLLRDMHYVNSSSRFLCITYTNRAADEMSDKVSNEYVYSSTIHSFLFDFLKPYLKIRSVIELYVESFKDKIEEKIYSDDIKTDERLQKYSEKYNCLKDEISINTIKNNIGEIDYLEAPFSIYLEGKLSHDDLLYFASILFKKYQVLNRKLTDRFDYIFIDEYQDTNNLIVELFYNAVKNTKTKLFLFGDRMQQIYNSTNTFLNEHIESFEKRDLNINYRSSSEIVNCLNNIYNDVHFIQKSNKGEYGIKPSFIISSNLELTLDKIKKNNDDYLELYLLNREKYEKIGVSNLYDVVSKLYPFGSRYTVNDILTTIDDNPNLIFNLMFSLCKIRRYYKLNNIGLLFNEFRNKTFLNSKFVEITKHDEKQCVNKKIFELISEIENGTKVIDLIEYLINNGIMKDVVLLETDENTQILLEQSTVSFILLFDFLSNESYVSTQHGVKGESHRNVIFISGNSNTQPHISTTELYKLFSLKSISFDEFNDFNYDYNLLQKSLSQDPNVDLALIESFYEKYKTNVYFEIICKERFDNYLLKKNKTTLSKINKTLVEKVFQAYKLFYVGCSRAMEKLYVLVDLKEVNLFKDRLISKMTSIGFNAKIE